MQSPWPQCVLMLVLGLSLSVSSSYVCPSVCQCNQHIHAVTCLDIGNVSMIDLLMKVPFQTTKLTIRGAKIDRIPTISFMNNLQNLTYLEISNSSVTTIADYAFAFLFNLKQLRLNNNKLKQLSNLHFRHLHKLQELDLSDNVIEEVDQEAFLSQQDLRRLRLHNNHIKNLPLTAFHPLTRLVELDVSNNDIVYLHPKSFMKLSVLDNLRLDSNKLDYIHEHLLLNLTSLSTLRLENNPWDCNCGLSWLVDKIRANATIYSIKSQNDLKLKCTTPETLSGMPLHALEIHHLNCTEPHFGYFTPKISIKRIGKGAVFCNATGTPKPSIYWVTPNGKVLATITNRKWMDPDIHQIETKTSFAGQPTYYKSVVELSEDGWLHLSTFRYIHSGVYECVAVNPAGLDSANVTVNIVSPVKAVFLESIFWGWAGAVGFLVFSLVFGIIRCLVERRNEKMLWKKNCSFEEYGIEVTLDSEGNYPGQYNPWDDRITHSVYDTINTPYDSPMKCTTPAEDGYYSDREGDQSLANIRDQLEDVRVRLRCGIEKQKERVRTRAATIRETGSHYVQNVRDRAQSLRESGSHYVHTIRSSSSQYANKIRHSGTVAATRLRSGGSHYAQRVRSGVVMGVEQVKCHVKSMKELCGTGELSHTISTVSVSTNLDSQTTMEVVRKITYV